MTPLLGLAPGETLIMGILNVTPDSFSDGGRWLEPDDAVGHAREMTRAGAAIIDVGGESTRPGTARVAEEEEAARVLPVVRALVAEGIAVSVDTMRARVAADALEAGARLVNDVSGGLADRDMGALVAAAGVPMVAMHWRGHSADMQRRTDYSRYDGYAAGAVEEFGAGGVPAVVAGVSVELAARVAALREAGVRDEQLILDPGLGFAKTPEQNWQLLAHLDHLAGLGFPLLIGASRKRFLRLLSRAADDGLAGRSADLASALVSLVCARSTVWGVRVHDVASTATGVRVAAALRAARGREDTG